MGLWETTSVSVNLELTDLLLAIYTLTDASVVTGRLIHSNSEGSLGSGICWGVGTMT